MFGWLFGRHLKDVALATKYVRIKGVRFKIRKINPLDYLDGSRALVQSYELYKIGKGGPPDESSIKKIKEHYSDVILAAVIHPKIDRKIDGDGFFVGDLFNDWSLAEGLYTEIMAYTYGKKKMKVLSSQRS